MDLKTVAILFIAALYCGCGNGDYRTMKSILPINVTLQEGDVIFRKGTGMASRVVTTADNDGVYSHVGIVVRKGNALMVVHAVPDEHDFDGDVDRVKLDSLDRFYSESYASRGEIMRHGDSIAASMAARKALEVYERGTLFDNDYDDEELVYDVPEGKFFFLGDNRPISKDSRRWINPYIDKDDIKGKLVLRFYPIKDFGSVN